MKIPRTRIVAAIEVVDARLRAILHPQLLKDQQTVNLARLHFDTELVRNVLAVAQPRHFDRKSPAEMAQVTCAPPLSCT